MPLADLLQWVEQARRHVRIDVARESGLGAWFVARDREVVKSSLPPARGVLSADGTASAPGPGLRAVTVESLLDLFLEREGTFTLRDLGEGESAQEGGVTLSLPIGFLVMEGLRQLDEWPRLDATYPDRSARLRVVGRSPATELGPVQTAILEVAQGPFGRERAGAARAPTLAELQIVLGLSRTALVRRVDELRAMGCVEVEGATPGSRDLGATLIDQAAVLVREAQYAEAAHVLRSLLAGSPGDERVRRLLEQTERGHLASCYAQVGRADVVRLVRAPKAPVSTADQVLLDALASKPRSVAALVLLSPLRELETLLALIRLSKQGYLAIDAG